MATLEALTVELSRMNDRVSKLEVERTNQAGTVAQVQAQVGQMTLASDGIRQLAQTTATDAAALKAKIDNIEQFVRDMARRVDDCVKGTKADRSDFSKKQDFKTMKVYSGEPKEFQSWLFQLRMRMTEHDKVYGDVFAWIKDLPTVPSQASFDTIVLDANHPADPAAFTKACVELWGVLHKKTGDKVETIIHNHEVEPEHLRGPMVLHRLMQDAQGMTGHRATKLTELILQPKATTLALLQDRFEKWEAHVRELLTDSKKSLPDCALATGLKAMLPADMQKYLSENPDRYTTTEEIKTYIRSALSMRREHFFAGMSANLGSTPAAKAAKAPKDEEMPQAMEMREQPGQDEEEDDEPQDQFSELDTYGVWKINGACHKCGQWGHMARDCYRSGKGSDGKSNNGQGKFGKGGKDNKGGSGKDGGPYGKNQQWPQWPNFQKGMSYGNWSNQNYGKGFGKNWYGKGKGQAFGMADGGNVNGWGSPFQPPTVGPQSFSLTTEHQKVQLPPRRVELSSRRTWELSNAFQVLQVSDEDYPDVETSKSVTVDQKDKLPRAVFEGVNQKKKTKAKKTKNAQPGHHAVPLEHTVNCLAVDQAQVHHLNSGGGQFVETVIDSGSTAHVMSDKDVAAYRAVDSPGSKAGQVFLSASGGRMANKGVKHLPVHTQEGDKFGLSYQIAEVSKCLTSVGELCDAADGSNFVVFHKTGGYIASPAAGTMTQFERAPNGGAYLLKVWVPDPADGSFPRQG